MRLPDQISPRANGNDGNLGDLIDRLDRHLYAHGLHVTLDNDFHELKRTGASLQKLPLTPNFDPDKIDIGPANGFWMKGVDLKGRTVMTQAARVYDLSRETLARLHEELRAFYADPAALAEEGESCECPAPAAHVITGRVCYHGELWLHSDFRGRDLTRALARLLMALVVLRWDPDYLFGMAQPGICRRGVAARYGYRNMQPHGMVWRVPSSGTLDEWLIWNDNEDLWRVLTQP